MTFSTQTETVLERFREISAIPRPSKKEERIGAWLREFAERRSWESQSDTAGNVVLRVPASAGREHEPIVVLQGHQDMVCEKTPETEHDFDHQGIVPVVDGEWLRAEGTTLGADNGIAIALALAIAEDPEVSHPPLELLFTVDEETGLTGASELDPSLLSGRILINIDSEDEGVLTVGCAGGTDVRIKWKPGREKRPKNTKPWTVRIGGLVGGHSGVQIHEKRANANVLLGRTLARIADEEPVHLVSVSGGSAHNAIPRDATATIWTAAEGIENIALEMRNAIAADYGEREPAATVDILPETDAKKKALSPKKSMKLINLLVALPHGVAMMSPDIEGLVETSSNLATVRSKKGKIEIGVSARSSNEANMNALVERISAVAHLVGAKAKVGNSYPSWEPDMDSRLLAKCREVYQQHFESEPVVEAIHAGLECGVIGAKFDSMDMISIGPTIRAPHSPDECLYLPSLDRVYVFLSELLKRSFQ